MIVYENRSEATTTTVYAAPCYECHTFMWSTKPLGRYHSWCAEIAEARALTRGMHAMVNGD